MQDTRCKLQVKKNYRFTN